VTGHAGAVQDIDEQPDARGRFTTTLAELSSQEAIAAGTASSILRGPNSLLRNNFPRFNARK
jgi:hypothetical protein